MKDDVDERTMLVAESETQPVAESVRKKMKEDHVMKELVSHCADEAAAKQPRKS